MVRPSLVLGWLCVLAPHGAKGHLLGGGLKEPSALEDELPKELLVADELERIREDEQRALRGQSFGRRQSSLAAVTTAAEEGSEVEDAEQEASADALDDASVNGTDVKKLFPAAHGLISKALDDMPDQLQNLAAQEAEQGDRAAAVQGTEQKATSNMLEGAQLLRQMKKMQVQVIVEDKVLQRLEEQQKYLHEDHDTVAARLRSIVAPRMALQHKRLTRQQKALAKVQKEEAGWENALGKHKADALNLLKERRQSMQAVDAADGAVKVAEHSALVARLHLRDVRDSTSREVEAVKYSQAKLQAQKSEVEDAKEEEKEAENSLDRIQNIIGYEQQRLTKNLDLKENKVSKKVVAAKAKKDQALHAMAQAREQFKAWQAAQKRKAAQVKTYEAEFKSRQTRLDNTRLHILTSASAKVGQDVVNRSHFDSGDWAWSGDGGDDDIDLATDA